MRHAVYMQSARWASRKAKYFRAHRRECHACGSTERIDLHHLSYERMGDEPDGDLMPLCESCHELVHLYAKERPTLALRDATMFAIAHARVGRVKAQPRPERLTPKQLVRQRRLELQERERARTPRPVRFTAADRGRGRPRQNT